MRFRINKKTGDRISEIGLGSAYMYEAGMEKAAKALRRACEGGINYFDLAAGDGSCFPIYGEALHDLRQSLFYQIHFGADYAKGTYGWSLDLDTIKRSVELQLKELRTDYIDYGFIHCQDEIADWQVYLKNGVYEYIQSLKEQDYQSLQRKVSCSFCVLMFRKSIISAQSEFRVNCFTHHYKTLPM